MIQRILILVVSSFVFDFIFGMTLTRRPDLFASIQSKVPRTKARHVYKLIFFLIAAILVVVLKEYFNLNDIIAAIILGLSLSLSGVIFRKSNGTYN